MAQRVADRTETQRIAEMIDAVASGDPWYGPSVATILRGVTAEIAARPGPGGGHSIWELVLHMTGWAREVASRLGGSPAQDPEVGDWPPVGEATPERWLEAQSAFLAAHEQLATAVRQADPAQLEARVVDFRDEAGGAGASYYATLHGLVHHTVYHAAQIALLKRAAQ